jgi:predicted Fe-S protein YdhL (DUF1289 family)
MDSTDMARRRWSGVSAAERSEIMRRAVLKRWAKRKTPAKAASKNKSCV